jgi:hypothetical protein
LKGLRLEGWNVENLSTLNPATFKPATFKQKRKLMTSNTFDAIIGSQMIDNA